MTHTLKWMFSSVAESGRLECTCGYHRVFSHYNYPDMKDFATAVRHATNEHLGRPLDADIHDGSVPMQDDRL